MKIMSKKNKLISLISITITLIYYIIIKLIDTKESLYFYCFPFVLIVMILIIILCTLQLLFDNKLFERLYIVKYPLVGSLLSIFLYLFIAVIMLKIDGYFDKSIFTIFDVWNWIYIVLLIGWLIYQLYLDVKDKDDDFYLEKKSIICIALPIILAVIGVVMIATFDEGALSMYYTTPNMVIYCSCFIQAIIVIVSLFVKVRKKVIFKIAYFFLFSNIISFFGLLVTMNRHYSNLLIPYIILIILFISELTIDIVINKKLS